MTINPLAALGLAAEPRSTSGSGALRRSEAQPDRAEGAAAAAEPRTQGSRKQGAAPRAAEKEDRPAGKRDGGAEQAPDFAAVHAAVGEAAAAAPVSEAAVPMGAGLRVAAFATAFQQGGEPAAAPAPGSLPAAGAVPAEAEAEALAAPDDAPRAAIDLRAAAAPADGDETLPAPLARATQGQASLAGAPPSSDAPGATPSALSGGAPIREASGATAAVAVPDDPAPPPADAPRAASALAMAGEPAARGAPPAAAPVPGPTAASATVDAAAAPAEPRLAAAPAVREDQPPPTPAAATSAEPVAGQTRAATATGAAEPSAPASMPGAAAIATTEPSRRRTAAESRDQDLPRVESSRAEPRSGDLRPQTVATAPAAMPAAAPIPSPARLDPSLSEERSLGEEHAALHEEEIALAGAASERSAAASRAAAPVIAADRGIAASAAGQLAPTLRKGADGTTEIRLDPPELGRVRVSLRLEDGGVVAVISAERPETADLMRRHADLFLRELTASGQGRVDLSFADFGSGAGGAGAGGDGGPPIFVAGAERTASEVAAAEAPKRAGLGRLDLRL